MDDDSIDAAIDATLAEIGPQSFSTKAFADALADHHPEVWAHILKEYGVGGRGAGKPYSSYSFVSQKLNARFRQEALEKLKYDKAPAGWGSPMIRYWQRDQSAASSQWSGAELRACVDAYHRLWLAQQNGETLNKSALREATLSGALAARSAAAYEYRMRNISAVLDELGMPPVTGYRPARNIGRAKAVIITMVNAVWGRQSVEAPTADAEAFLTRALSAKQKFEAGDAAPPPGAMAVKTSLSSSKQYVRDPNVAGWVLSQANGYCEACGEKAPFVRANGEPFLEVHHVCQLSHGGPDQVDNTVALCPNCHRRLHFSDDRETYRHQLFKAVPRLKRYKRVGNAPDEV